MNKDCPFCTSARTESRILKEGKHAYVILSNPRLMPGHILVIPKRHVEGKLKDLNEDERKEIFNFLVEFQTKVLEKLTLGCDIRQNFKPYVADSKTHVNHLHFHIYPRYNEDELHEKVDIHRKPVYRDLSDEERDRLVTLLS